MITVSSKWACVCRMGSIGDNLIASSVLPLIKSQGYMVEVMAQAPSHIVFENNPYIDKLTVLRPEDLPNNNQDWQQYFVKRAREYDKFFHLSHSIEGHLALHPDSTRFWWPAEYRRKFCGASYLETAHDICEVPREYAPAFFPTEEETAKAIETKGRVGERVIGWVIAGSRIDKIHPYSAMAIGRLIKELGVAVVMLGPAAEREFTAAKAIEEHVERQNGSKAGLHLGMSTSDMDSWPLRRSISFLHQCDLIIGPDTGLMWGVASQPTPKIMMLGHASPRNITYGWRNTTTLHADPTRVPCWPCHRLHNDPSTCMPNRENNGAACISDVSVEMIMAAARKAILRGAIAS